MSKEDLQRHQANNRESTITNIMDARKKIETELQKFGYYPHNRGRVTLKEVCRRANVGQSTLKNATHRSTRDDVQRWLKRLKQIAPVAKVDADMVKRERTKALIKHVETIAMRYNRFKIEYDGLLGERDSLEKENLGLKSENTDLQGQVSSLESKVADLQRQLLNQCGSNVVPFPGPGGSL